MHPIDQFREAIAAGIVPPAEIIPDGKLHRFSAESHGKSKNSWYVYYDDSDLPAGAFGDWKMGISETWCGKSPKTLTTEEKRAYAKRMEAAKQARETEAERVAAECRAWCAKTWETAPPVPADHPYLVRKQIPPGELRLYRTQDDAGALMVPIKALDGTIHGIQFISPDGTKKFKTGSAKVANCFRIGTITDTIVICEGYATGASINAATGLPVLVAFDAGNLQPVAELVRSKRPNLIIIIAADNDAWCKITLESGEIEHKRVPCNVAGKRRVNTGVTKAKEAAEAVGGRVVVPQFADTTDHPTDFNDLAYLEGLDAVRLQFEAQPEEEQADQAYEVPPPEFAAEPVQHDTLDCPFFQRLGYDRGEYFYLSHGTGQVKGLTADKHTAAHLLTLAPLNWWEGKFTDGKKSGGGFNELGAKNWLIQTTHDLGIYDSDRVRGLGAWEDDGRSVLHLGDFLRVDGERVALPDMKSKFIYERAIPISDEETQPLSAKDANKLVQLCDMLSWEKPINSRLLAGWIVASIVCGALQWRPHIWLTGPAGTGKSFVIDNIIKHVAGRHLKGMLGTTTEAGMRRVLRNNAFSVIFDEFDAEDHHAEQRIQSILEFARPCSSNNDSKIYKARQGGDGVDSFQPRSCIGVASVNVKMSQRADTSRVSVLSLVKGDSKYFDQVIKPFCVSTLTPAFARGLRARAILQIPTINKNADVFQEAVSKKLGSRRDGDQYGSLLACSYSLFKNTVVTLDEAQDFVDKQDWEGHSTTAEQKDELRCLQAILAGRARVQCRMGSFDVPVGELIQIAAQWGEEAVHEHVTKEAATAELKRIGIRLDFMDGFWVSNNHPTLAMFLQKTPWATSWCNVISRLEGAQKSSSPVRFGAGHVSRSVLLPIRYVA